MLVYFAEDDEELQDICEGVIDSPWQTGGCASVAVNREETLRMREGFAKAAEAEESGTGYSSLAYLRRLPAQEIKIDRSFVLNMDNNVDDKTIVCSVIDLARNLGMEAVAEGVENRESYDLLREMECYCAQGYFISRPVG